MTRVIVADGCQQVDSPLTGRRYYARGGRAFEGSVRGGVFDMTPADARLAVKMGGAVASMAGTTRGGLGWRCPACGFGAYLRRCGRCGGECVREGGEAGAAGDLQAAVVDADPPAEEEGQGAQACRAQDGEEEDGAADRA